MNRSIFFSAALFLAPGVAYSQAPPTGTLPPPPPAIATQAETPSWYAGIGGERKGPFTPTQIKSQITAGTITSETLIWTAGMSAWQSAKSHALFSPSFMKSTTTPPSAGTLPPPPATAPALNFSEPPAPALQENAAIHTAAAGNTAGHTTYLNRAGFNGNPSALIHITPVWNPVGKEPVYHDHAVGVRYEPSLQKWGIFNQDQQAMQPGSSFVVVTADAVHTASPTNTVENATYVDFARVNGNSSAPFQITANQTPGGKQALYNDHPVGIWYDVSRNLWTIFNQDMSPLPAGTSFNIRFKSSWTFWSNAEDTVENSAYLNGIPPAKGNQAIGMTATQYWNPGASPQGTYNPHHIGVWYDPGAQVWAVFNQDLQPMPPKVAFEVEFHTLAPQ